MKHPQVTVRFSANTAQGKITYPALPDFLKISKFVLQIKKRLKSTNQKRRKFPFMKFQTNFAFDSDS